MATHELMMLLCKLYLGVGWPEGENPALSLHRSPLHLVFWRNRRELLSEDLGVLSICGKLGGAYGASYMDTQFSGLAAQGGALVVSRTVSEHGLRRNH